MLADNLRHRNSLSDKELVTYLLNGLGPAFEIFVTSITTRSNPISFPKLYYLLLIHENRVTHNSKLTNPTSHFESFANLSSSNQRDQREQRTYVVKMVMAVVNILKIVVVTPSIPILKTLNPTIALFAKFVTSLGM